MQEQHSDGIRWRIADGVGRITLDRPERAKQLFFLSEPVDAQRCLALGIVDAVYAEEAFAAGTEALVARLAAAATGSLARVKRLCEGVGARRPRRRAATSTRTPTRPACCAR